MIQSEQALRILTQLTEDEEFASDAMQRPWRCQDNFVEDLDGGTIARFEIAGDARHAAVHSPERTLREVRALRTIVDLCMTETDATGGKPLALRVLRELAKIYDK